MRIYLLNPHHSGSHRAWAEGLARQFPGRLELFTLPGSHWKWRMHGAALHFAALLREKPIPDLILTTDMLDVATFRGIYGREVPVSLYFHENQLTYPWSPTDQDPGQGRDRHYGWLNITSALAADRIAFNSEYHRSAFLAAIPEYLAAFPDHRPKQVAKRIAARSHVLPVGVDLPSLPPSHSPPLPPSPVLLWNHRWEYDKGPDEFLQLCRQLHAEAIPFKLMVLGQAGQRYPASFDLLRQEFNNRIVHWGYAQDRAQYWSLLQQADLQPVTSRQDFFGISVVEAMWAGVIPLLPNRLVFPERAARIPILYNGLDHLVDMIRRPPRVSINELTAASGKFAWSQLGPRYAKWLVPP